MITQFGLAFFGLTAVWLSMGHSLRGRRWAPIVGLCGQPFWAAHAISANAWGIGLTCAAFTLVYIRGAWVQWRPAR